MNPFYAIPDKQFLITRDVPCQTRVASMENCLATEDAEDGDEDWLVSRLVKETDIEDDFDILDEDGEVVKQNEAAKDATGENDEEDEYADMDGFEDNNILQDDAAAAPAPEESNLVKVRTYDLSITYDKYYQTQ